ncbi:uncharacterized protein EDB91DRAFT_1078509 [Suillus paluster]|uniref:uncharacterized protein n=1 Tax=Suillus paluster TaxID=48578 RepID=UPI001B87E09E|nr:uncharacterized protein EDB91DRAFT_1078509 [Suillus paluster]KAG1750483.1 hypothetical protein EDB91DRAFT_1078509 [Suillus paluster]
MSSGGSWTINSRTGTMPVFITQCTEWKRDSFTSLSTDISIDEFNIAFDEAKEIPYSPTESITGSISKEFLPSTPVQVDGQAVPLPDPPVLARPDPVLDIHSVPRIPTALNYLITICVAIVYLDIVAFFTASKRRQRKPEVIG